MKIITINTQREFDELPNKFGECTEINIVGKLARINRNIGNALRRKISKITGTGGER